MTAAIELSHIGKEYKLYPGQTSMLLDWSGYYALRFWKKRPAFPIKKALADVTATIKKGERLGLIGRNGAGKTTLLKIIGGMVQPTSGAMRTYGKTQALMKLGVGFHPDFSGANNVLHSLLYNGLRGKDLEYAYDEVLDFAELGEFIHQPMRNYSLGMAARLQFAVATAITPDILLIDEVMGAGDSYFATKSAERMRKLTHSGCTLILVSHSRGQILEFCDTALWLDNGQVMGHGPVDEITAAYDAAITEAISGQKADEAPSGFIPLPAYLRRDHILRRIEEITAPGANWQQTDFSGALSRLMAENAMTARFSAIECRIATGPGNQVSTGDEFKIEFRITKPNAAPAKLAVKLLFFDGHGNFVAEASSPETLRRSTNVDWSFNLSPFPLGYRDYLITAALYENGSLVDAIANMYLKVLETNESDPPYLLHHGKWYFDKNPVPVPARIHGAI